MSSSVSTTTTTTTKKGRKPSYFRPEAGNKSIEYWKKMYYSANAARREGWKRYYETEERSLVVIRNVVKEIPGGGIPPHIKAEYMRLVTQFDETKRECPVCMEIMKFEDSELTKCGHMFHLACLNAALERHDVCPICRTQQ